jgi:hypothetical protein
MVIALHRGEIDMMITYGDSLLDQFKSDGNFLFLAQTGESHDGKLVAGSRFPDVPVFSDLVKPKLKNPQALKSFEAWETLSRIGKWVALPPNTPADIVAAYRKAFLEMTADKEFEIEAARILGEGYTVASGEEMQRVTALSGAISDDELEFFRQLKAKVGINVDKAAGNR